MKHNAVLGALVAGATALVLAGCGNGTTTATPPAETTPPAAESGSAAASAEHNDADVAFVQGMIPHHSQAVEMSALAETRASSDKVKQLAAEIEQAQAPEIEQMRGLLKAWGAPESGSMSESMPGMTPDTGDDATADAGGMGGMHEGMGMMSDAQMQSLGQASGAEFDRMFLTMMIEHHNGAIQMAQTELGDGQNPEAKALAQKIIDNQRAEVTTMQGLLATL